MCGKRKIALFVTLFTFTLLLQQSTIRWVGVQAVPVPQRAAVSARPATNRGNAYPVVYTRKIRRRPPQFPEDKYIEEILETFDFQHGPPRRPYVHDDDDDEVDRMIRCDFDPTLSECELLHKPLRRPQKRPKATRPRPVATTTTTTTTPSTARSSPPWPWATATTTTARTPAATTARDTTTPRYTFVEWWTTTTTTTPELRMTTTPAPRTTTTTPTPAPKTTTTTTEAASTTTTTTTPVFTTPTTPAAIDTTTTEYLPFLPAIPDWEQQEPEYADSTTIQTVTFTPSNSAEPSDDDNFLPVVGDIEEMSTEDYADEYNNHDYEEEKDKEEEEVNEDYRDEDEEPEVEEDKAEMEGGYNEAEN